MLVSAHFTLAELTVTDQGVDNTPNLAEIAVLKHTAAAMENVRSLLGNHAIAVNSAFRSDAVNRAVGGVPNSAHRLGYAVDFTCEAAGDPLHVCRALDAAAAAGRLAFDQLIQEGSWTHISFDPRRRGQRLTKRGDSYVIGILPS